MNSKILMQAQVAKSRFAFLLYDSSNHLGLSSKTTRHKPLRLEIYSSSVCLVADLEQPFQLDGHVRTALFSSVKGLE